MTKRKKDINGFWEIKGNPISRSGTFEYLGSEIGAADPNKIYIVYRPEKELSNEKTINSFKLMPIVNEHEMLGDGFSSSDDKGVSGAIGEDIYFEDGVLKANLKIYSEEMKSDIESGKKDLSPGFRCKYTKKSGVAPDGNRYDYIQSDIVGNHLALVGEGRSGSDISVMDRAIINKDKIEKVDSNMDEKIIALLEAILAAVKKDEDLDEEVLEEVSDEDSSEDEENSEDMESFDEDVSEDDESEDASEDEEENSAMDSSKEIASLKKMIADQGKQIASLTAAMDSNLVMKEIAKREKIVSSLREIGIACDSSAMTAKQAAEYGCKKLGIKHQKGHAETALDAALQVIEKQSSSSYSKGPLYRPAQDSSASVDIHSIFKGGK